MIFLKKKLIPFTGKISNYLVQLHSKWKKQVFLSEQKDIHCGYCGTTVNEWTMTIDHIKSKASGGSNDPENLLLACKACNKYKGPYHLEVFRKKTIGKDRKFYFESGESIYVNYANGYKPLFLKNDLIERF